MLTRTEAKMIAQELYKLMKEDREEEVDELLTTEEAAKLLKVAVKTIENNRLRYPGRKIGSRWMYSRKALREMMGVRL